MKKSKWKGYAPVLAMASLAVVLGVLTLCGVIDLGTLPQLVADKPALAVLVALGLYALKGISVAVVYHVLVVSVALVFPLPAALVINAVGLVISLTASYLVGRHTDPSDLNGLLDRHPRIKRFLIRRRRWALLPALLSTRWASAWRCWACCSACCALDTGRIWSARGWPSIRVRCALPFWAAGWTSTPLFSGPFWR